MSKNVNQHIDHGLTCREKEISGPCTRCTDTRGRKTKIGASLDQKIVKKIDDMVQESSDLRATRSEMVEAVLTAYFRSRIKHSEKARELIMARRKGLL